MFGRRTATLLYTLALGALSPVNAQQGPYFVLGGGGQPLTIERVDPLLSAGKTPSQHVHSVVGGNGFAASMDFAQTQKSTCATIDVKADKSNYWMPNLYFHVPSNGSFIRVPEQPCVFCFCFCKDCVDYMQIPQDLLQVWQR